MIAALVAILTAAAQPAPPDCDNAETTLDMNECALKGYEAADAEMNAQWKRTLEAYRQFDKDPDYPPEGVPRGESYSQTLIKAQRAWLAYRDAHCTEVSHYPYAGSMEPVLFNECMLELTTDRTTQLADLEKAGGD